MRSSSVIGTVRNSRKLFVGLRNSPALSKFSYAKLCRRGLSLCCPFSFLVLMFGRRYHPLESIVSGMIVKDHFPIPSHPRVEFVRLKLRIGLRLLVELLFEQGENLWMFGFDSGATTAIALAFNFLPVVKFFEPSRDGLSVPFE